MLTSEMLEASAGATELIGSIDRGLFAILKEYRTPRLTEAVLNISALGSGIVLSIFVSTLCLLFLSVGQKHFALQLVIAALGSAILTWVLKSHFERVRPSLIEHLTFADGYSYPSGHSLSSASVYFTLAIILNNISLARSSKLILISMLLLIILAIGFSRIYLGVHYFSDITAGILLGIAWASLVGALDFSRIIGRLSMKREN